MKTTTRLRQSWDYARKAAIATFFAAILCSYAHDLLLPYETHSDLVHLAIIVVRELGMALFIATVLTVTVEYSAQRRHERVEQLLALNAQRLSTDIAHDVLKAVALKYLPASTVKQVEDQLFGKTLYRPESSVTYRLRIKEDPDRPGRRIVIWTQYHSYTITNVNHAECGYPVRAEVALDPGLEKYFHLRRLAVDGIEICETAGSKEGYQISKVGDGIHGTVLLTYKIVIGALQTRRVEYEIEGAGPEQTWEQNVTRLPVDKYSLTVHHEPGTFDVTGIALHPEDARRISNYSSMIQWTIDGLLPGQGMAFMWRACPEKPVASTS